MYAAICTHQISIHPYQKNLIYKPELVRLLPVVTFIIMKTEHKIFKLTEHDRLKNGSKRDVQYKL